MADADPIIWAKSEVVRLKEEAGSPTRRDKLVVTARAIQFLQENARETVFYEYAVESCGQLVCH
jgi:hypothetical protein